MKYKENLVGPLEQRNLEKKKRRVDYFQYAGNQLIFLKNVENPNYYLEKVKE